MGLVNQRADADWLRGEYAASERRVCGLMRMAVSSYRYQATRSDDELRTRLVELAREKPRCPRFAPVFWVSSPNTFFTVCPDTSFTVFG